MSTPTIPTISEVERIAELADLVLRNLQITQCYHELALGMVKRTGWNANWCTFAAWASKQAGQTIRKEDLGRMLEASLESEGAALQAAHDLRAPLRRNGSQLRIDEILKLIWKAYDPQSVFDRSSAAVARGNLKVFIEIAREFARFYAECLPDQVYIEQNITRFVEQLRPGDPPDGQRYLQQAFRHYYQALFEGEEKACLELLLLANLEIGFHEQTRLQPEINEALNAPIISPQEFARNLLALLRPEWGWYGAARWLLLRLLGRLKEFDAAVEGFVATLQREAQWIITEYMMTIELPHNQHLRLGEDLTAGFPPILQHISNPNLLALLAQIDPTPDSLRDSGADYWGDLPDRIHFIADMFRCYQAARELFEPPFTEEQTITLKESGLPRGRL
jgi:hypothetical protein